MKYQSIKLRDLVTHSDCMEAIDAIESDYRNSLGGLVAWNSGRETFLLSAAKQKIARIESKAKRMADRTWAAGYKD